MGENAEMVLEGILCQYCGEYIDGEAPGYPRSCGCDGGDEYHEDNDYETYIAEHAMLCVFGKDVYSKFINKKIK